MKSWRQTQILELIDAEAVVTLSNGEEIARGEGTMYIVEKNRHFRAKES